MRRTISEISKEVNTTKQNVNQLLKKAMRKVYLKARNMFPEASPFDTVIIISKMFEVNSQKDFQHFFYDFPKEIREEVINSLKDTSYIKNSGIEIESFYKKGFINKKVKKIEYDAEGNIIKRKRGRPRKNTENFITV